MVGGSIGGWAKKRGQMAGWMGVREYMGDSLVVDPWGLIVLWASWVVVKPFG